MADKLIMGYWDCAFCGEKKIRGTQRACPACGKVRGADAVFYMLEEEKQELTEEEAKTKGKGADWYCSFCDSLNSVLDPVCKSCGATREESEKNYFELQEKKAEAARKKEEQKKEVEEKRTPPHKRSPLMFLIPIILLIGAAVFMLMPKKADLKITDVYWNSIISIEKNQQVEESDWSVPSGGIVQREREEIRRYEQVLDHYDTQTSYQNNGDGTFTEVTSQVPVYREEPVYATKYYYLIWRWLPERTVETEGHDKNPVWGDPKLKSDERESNRTTIYKVTGQKEDKEKTYNCSEEIWNKLNVGDAVECMVAGGSIVELK